LLYIKIPISPEGWDEEKEEFVESKTVTLQLEHSLVSLSKWESKWCKAFLSKQEKSQEETIDYIRCMTVTKNVDPEVYKHLTADNIRAVNKYIEAPMTATHIAEAKGTGKGQQEVVTSELIYYWMIALQIPMECQKWHLNRLLTLVKVCNVKNSPPKNMSRRDRMSQYARMNAARRQKHNSRG
jgi:hypothetical protein